MKAAHNAHNAAMNGVAVTDAGAPLVSVIIPTFNRGDSIGRCLESLVAQTFRDFEVLVCDDGSTDETGTVVASFAKRLTLRYEWSANSGGAAHPRNIGLSMARGEYVAFLDSDDWWLPNKLEVAVRHLMHGADIVYHDLYEAHQPAPRFFSRRIRARHVGPPVLDDLIMNGNALNTSPRIRARCSAKTMTVGCGSRD